MAPNPHPVLSFVPNCDSISELHTSSSHTQTKKKKKDAAVAKYNHLFISLTERFYFILLQSVSLSVGYCFLMEARGEKWTNRAGTWEWKWWWAPYCNSFFSVYMCTLLMYISEQCVCVFVHSLHRSCASWGRYWRRLMRRKAVCFRWQVHTHTPTGPKSQKKLSMCLVLHLCLKRETISGSVVNLVTHTADQMTHP